MGFIEEDDPELRTILEFLHEKLENTPAFHRFLDPKQESPDWEHSRIVFNMKDDFVGNIFHRILHGGIIASMIDTAGGHAVFLNAFKHLRGQPMEKQLKQIIGISSIDFRIDFLRPGTGKQLIAEGWILRTGRKVAVTRMELRNEEGKLIAVGTGTYTVG